MKSRTGTPEAKVKGLAAENDLNQEDVAELIGRNRRYVGDRYHGKGYFSSSELEKLAKHFGVSVGSLFGEAS